VSPFFGPIGPGFVPELAPAPEGPLGALLDPAGAAIMPPGAQPAPAGPTYMPPWAAAGELSAPTSGREEQ